jgi:chromosome segregation ATPase
VQAEREEFRRESNGLRADLAAARLSAADASETIQQLAAQCEQLRQVADQVGVQLTDCQSRLAVSKQETQNVEAERQRLATTLVMQTKEVSYFVSNA